MEEIWKDIKEYEGLYQVSNMGRVKSLKRKDASGHLLNERLLSIAVTHSGYKYVGFYKDNQGKKFKVHRLVAQAFIPNPSDYPQVNHIDEDKTNNCVNNLEWCSAKYNANYGTKIERQIKNTNYKELASKRSHAERVRISQKPCIGFYKGVAREFHGVGEASEYTKIPKKKMTLLLKDSHKVLKGWSFKYKK